MSGASTFAATTIGSVTDPLDDLSATYARFDEALESLAEGRPTPQAARARVVELTGLLALETARRRIARLAESIGAEDRAGASADVELAAALDALRIRMDNDVAVVTDWARSRATAKMSEAARTVVP